MVPRQTSGVTLCVTLAILTSMIYLTGCSRPEKEVVTVTKVEKTTVPKAAPPKPLQLTDTRVFVVTEDNFEQFVEEFTREYGELAFVALSMKDYENLALNVAEIKRFLNRQREIILYYENAVTPESQ